MKKLLLVFAAAFAVITAIVFAYTRGTFVARLCDSLLYTALFGAVICCVSFLHNARVFSLIGYAASVVFGRISGKPAAPSYEEYAKDKKLTPWPLLPPILIGLCLAGISASIYLLTTVSSML